MPGINPQRSRLATTRRRALHSCAQRLRQTHAGDGTRCVQRDPLNEGIGRYQRSDPGSRHAHVSLRAAQKGRDWQRPKPRVSAPAHFPVRIHGGHTVQVNCTLVSPGAKPGGCGACARRLQLSAVFADIASFRENACPRRDMRTDSGRLDKRAGRPVHWGGEVHPTLSRRSSGARREGAIRNGD